MADMTTEIPYVDRAPVAWVWIDRSWNGGFRCSKAYNSEAEAEEKRLHSGRGIVVPFFYRPMKDAEGDGGAVPVDVQTRYQGPNKTVNTDWRPCSFAHAQAVKDARCDVTEIRYLYTHPARSGVVSDALGALYYSLPDVLPASANERFTKTGKWLNDRGWEMKGFTGRLEYRSDDMVSVYAAMDQARATLESYERSRK